MNTGKIRGFVFLCAVLLGALALSIVTGCTRESKDDDFKRVSELIADRNKARQSMKSSSRDTDESRQPGVEDRAAVKDSDTASPEEEILSIVLYEEDVRIVSQGSGKLLARGVAYINKQGQIVRLKIVNE